MKLEAIEDLQILGKQAIPHLWKDEAGDVFILTKRMEIYAFSQTVLGCYCFHRKTYLQLAKKGLIFKVHETSDPLVWFRTDRKNLPLLLSLGTFKRRPRLKGKWVRDKERLLGHKILPCYVKASAIDGLN
jgi:hypothetical protein